MKTLREIIESSNLNTDIDLKSLLDSKSEIEFEQNYKILENLFQNNSSTVSFHDFKPRKLYIVFVETTDKRYCERECLCSIYFGTTSNMYQLTWDRKENLVNLKENKRIGLYQIARDSYALLRGQVYDCPDKIRKDANKLIKDVKNS